MSWAQLLLCGLELTCDRLPGPGRAPLLQCLSGELQPERSRKSPSVRLTQDTYPLLLRFAPAVAEEFVAGDELGEAVADSPATCSAPARLQVGLLDSNQPVVPRPLVQPPDHVRLAELSDQPNLTRLQEVVGSWRPPPRHSKRSPLPRLRGRAASSAPGTQRWGYRITPVIRLSGPARLIVASL